jgi:hypothetical protein
MDGTDDIDGTDADTGSGDIDEEGEGESAT